MRARIALVLEEDLLAKIDVIAGDRQKRSAVIVKAIREFIAREESKALSKINAEAAILEAK